MPNKRKHPAGNNSYAEINRLRKELVEVKKENALVAAKDKQSSKRMLNWN